MTKIPFLRILVLMALFPCGAAVVRGQLLQTPDAFNGFQPGSDHMTQAGIQGVSQNYLFDDYWPGFTETFIWKNMIGKGLGDYIKSIHMPDPRPAGR